MTGPERLNVFVRLSAILTGFREVELWGTAMAEPYLRQVRLVGGEARVAKLLDAAGKVLDGSRRGRPAVEHDIQATILAHDEFGPVARNVIKLWYTGVWNQLPQTWWERYGAGERDTEHVISAAAYHEGLVWTAMGAHPRGAKPQGFGAWALPPRDPGAATRRKRRP